MDKLKYHKIIPTMSYMLCFWTLTKMINEVVSKICLFRIHSYDILRTKHLPRINVNWEVSPLATESEVTPSVASEKASPHQTFPLGVAPISPILTQHPPSFTVSPPPFFVMSTPHHQFHHLPIFAKSQSVPPHLGANRFVAAPHWGSGG